MSDFHLLFAPPAYGTHYRREQLDLPDKERLKNHPRLEAKASWRTSRALKQRCREQFPAQPFCISHKNDHALIAPGADKPGTDLERAGPRDCLTLIEQVGNREEIEHIRQLPDPQLDFYRLWTLKESLIKAENLHFPKDMRAVGVTRFVPHWQLHGTMGRGYSWISAQLNQNWLIAGIWPQTEEHFILKARLIFHAPRDFPVSLHRIISNHKDLTWKRAELPTPATA